MVDATVIKERQVSTPPAEKKAYPLRISSDVLDAVQRWAQDELRSVNAQIEYVLREALRKAGRMPPPSSSDGADQTPPSS
jgi:hypothetical protein